MVMVLPVEVSRALRRLLFAQIGRLRTSLDSLVHWLRENIANAAGKGVTTVLSALLGLDDLPTQPYAERHRAERHATWHRYGDPEWPDEPDDEFRDDEPLATSQSAAPPKGRAACWLSALAAAVQAASWWLRRQPGRAPVLTALSAAVVTAVATCTTAPIVAAILGLSVSALGLLALADACRGNAAALAEAVEP